MSALRTVHNSMTNLRRSSYGRRKGGLRRIFCYQRLHVVIAHEVHHRFHIESLAPPQRRQRIRLVESKVCDVLNRRGRAGNESRTTYSRCWWSCLRSRPCLRYRDRCAIGRAESSICTPESPPRAVRWPCLRLSRSSTRIQCLIRSALRHESA